VLVLGGCGLFTGTPAPEGSDALISVLVTGDVPDGDLSLEIGGSAWSVTDGAAGTAGLSAPDPQTVRLLRVDDCEELASFEAEPGSAHAIVFAADGAATVEERTESQDAGQPLERRDRAACS
jgi:hypothetical protein